MDTQGARLLAARIRAGVAVGARVELVTAPRDDSGLCAGDRGVVAQIDEHGRVVLDTLSVEHRGGFLFVFINGRMITNLQIDKRVSDGKIYIPSGLTAADVELMKKQWRLLGERKR